MGRILIQVEALEQVGMVEGGANVELAPGLPHGPRRPPVLLDHHMLAADCVLGGVYLHSAKRRFIVMTWSLPAAGALFTL